MILEIIISGRIDFLSAVISYSYPFKYNLSIVRGGLTPRQIELAGRGCSPLFYHDRQAIMIKQRLFQSNPLKTPSVFDGLDFLFARLHPVYKMPSAQRARKDELYKVAEVITSFYC